MTRCRLWFAIALLSFVAAGCTPGVVELSGEIRVDEAAVDTGTIRFLPFDGEGAPGEGKIENGRYEVAVPPGRKKVEIRAFRKDGQSELPGAPGQMVDNLTPLLGAEFNEQTQVATTVEPSQTTLNFSIDSSAGAEGVATSR